MIALQGGRNFRDLGGYSTQEGRRVRMRRVYRSGVLAYLTDEDHAHLCELGIRVVCDFRAPNERTREPVRWRDAQILHRHWDYDQRTVNLRGMLVGLVGSESLDAAKLVPDITRRAMLKLYRAMPTRLQEPYTWLFRQLIAGELPLVFNCSAGKDRTGVAAALILTALGVPREQIFADYMLTSQVVDLEKVLFSSPIASVGIDDHGYLTKIGREAREPILTVHPEYLEAMFEQLATDFGSTESYLEKHLGLGPRQLSALRAQLLED
ncbi:MAG TPA: tyrosine-protein phosphatase [Steroidobacteraceae bacterium]|nr:tyrosine-protein phosphatase [Steroidobacteraceae bacterium]